MRSANCAPVVGSGSELAVFSAEASGRTTLCETERMQMVLVGLEPGQELAPQAPGLDLAVAVLSGTGRLLAGDEEHWVRAGDVAVIPAGATRGLQAVGGRLVALDVTSPPPGDGDDVTGRRPWPDLAAGPDPGELIRREHAGLRAPVAELGALAAEGPGLDGAAARGRLDASVRFLREELLGHAFEEERSVYPAVEGVLRATGGATATMAADHRRIAKLTRELEAAAEATPSEAGWERLRRLLYGLQALVELHLEKEEEVYLPALGRLSPQARAALVTHLAGGEQPPEED